jgi:hypothetical protein
MALSPQKFRQATAIFFTHSDKLHSESPAALNALDHRFRANLSLWHEEIEFGDRADNAILRSIEKEAARAHIADGGKVVFARTSPKDTNAFRQLNSSGKPAGIDRRFGQNSLHPAA